MLGRSLWLLQINEKIGRKMHKFLWFIFECVALADYVHCLNKGSDNVALFLSIDIEELKAQVQEKHNFILANFFKLISAAFLSSESQGFS